MGYKTGSLGRGTVNGKGSKGRRLKHFNANVTRMGFKQLASAVQSAAEKSAKEILSDHGSYTMSFDEVNGIPTNVPGSGTVTISGLGENPVETEGQMQQLTKQAASKLEQAFVEQIKELGL